MKYQSLFCGKSREKKLQQQNITNLSSAELAQRVVKVKTYLIAFCFFMKVFKTLNRKTTRLLKFGEERRDRTARKRNRRFQYR